MSPGPLSLLVLAAALSALGLAARSALRRPILLRMALRNPGRRRGQALAIALGLLVATAIIAGSLATGDSMTFAIRQSAIDAFGELDETVAVEGRLYFPERVAEALERDAAVRAATDAIAPILLEDVAVGHAAAKQWEPRAALIGVDPERDPRFGLYRTAQGLASAAALRPGEAILNERLASSIEAEPGDVVQVRYAKRPDPLLPRLFAFNGSLTLAAGSPAPLPLPGAPPPYAGSPADEARFEFPVEAGAVRVTAVLLWRDPRGHADLDLVLETPRGEELLNANGSLGSPDAPAILNASAEPGTWAARAVGKAAVQQPFTLAVLVFYETRDLEALARFLEDAERHPEARELVDRLAGSPRLEARNFTVRFVALEPGRGGFLNAPDVFVRLDEAQAMFGKEGRVNVVMVSNPGDAEQGLEGTAEAMEALRAALARLEAQEPGGELEGLRPRGIKEEWVEEAARAGGLLSSFLTMMGSFSILAGLILIVNIFLMLAEERRGELGIARALGLTRRDVARLFVYEGAAYALVASALGALLGLAVSFALVAALNAAWGERILLDLPFRPTPDSVLLAFGAGVLLSLGAVLAAAHRAARLNIVRSIRRLEEPDVPVGRGAWLLGAPALAAGLPLTLLALGGGSFALLVLAPNLAILGAALLALRWVRRSHASRAAGLAMLASNAWSLVAFDTPATTEGMVLAPLRGVLMVVAAVLVLVQSRALLRGSAALLARLPGLAPVARTALAYPLHKRLRTGLTVVMFGLVLAVVVLFSLFFAMFTPNVADQSGGYEVRAESTLPVDDLAQRLRAAEPREPALRGVASVTSLTCAEVWGGKLLRVDGQPVRYHGPPVDHLYGFDEAFARSQDFALLELDPRFGSAREAYLAALRDPSLAIVSQLYTNGEDGRPGFHHVGATLTMKGRGGELNFTIIAVQKQVYYGGVFLAREVVEQNFDGLHGIHLLRLEPGSDARAVARAVEASQEELGMDAASVEEEAEELLAQQRRLYALFEVYLGLGLVLGVASLGIASARSVLERRQEVGMLRAIGMPRRLVFRAFLLEGLFVVGLGAVVGVAVGFLVAWGVHTRTLAALGIPFVVPWLDLAAILGVALAATFLATLGPARRAARLPPAEAIRYIE